MKRVDIKKHQIPAYAVTERIHLTLKKVDTLIVRDNVDRRKSRRKIINFLPVVEQNELY